MTPSGAYEVPASWQTGLVNGAQAGEIVGLFINGYVAERFGYRCAASHTLFPARMSALTR